MGDGVAKKGVVMDMVIDIQAQMFIRVLPIDIK